MNDTIFIDLEVQAIISRDDRGRSKKKKEMMTSTGLDPVTLSVLRIRDNQLLQPAIVEHQCFFYYIT